MIDETPQAARRQGGGLRLGGNAHGAEEQHHQEAGVPVHEQHHHQGIGAGGLNIPARSG